MRAKDYTFLAARTLCHIAHIITFVSLSCEVIQRRTRRGERSAGYGFVEVATDDAVKKAVDELDGKELEGRTVVVNLADSAEQKEKKRAERKVKKRVGRRGSKAVPGEVTEAEANGEAEKPATTADAEGENKPKKKKKSNTVCHLCFIYFSTSL